VRRLVVVAALAIATTALACEIVGGIETFSYVEADAGEPDAADPDAGVVAAANGCPSGRGPVMVRVGGTCIDATEVTQAQYAEFLRAGYTEAQPLSCAWNKSYVPGEGPPVKPSFCESGGDAPRGCVDWCDAFMFCAWSGKRLCGSPSGATADFARPTDSASSQWYAACSSNGTRAYPYGATYDPKACNGVGQGRGFLTPAGAIATCEGGTPGVFDMSGNVWEWEDACTKADGGVGGAAAEPCRFRGGSVTDDAAQLRCDSLGAQPRDFQQYNVGFRCCAAARR